MNTKQQKRNGLVCVLGSGAWGTALACVASRSGHETFIWGRSEATAAEINTKNTNTRYLGEVELEKGITASTNLRRSLEDAAIVVLAIPTQTLSSVLRAKEFSGCNSTVLCACKGIDRETGKLPSQLVRQRLPEARVGTLSGPSFAVDVVRNLPTAVTIAFESETDAAMIALELSTDNFRCYASGDLMGVELGGALKNVLALAVGAARGMELGASAEAALIARGFAEINRIATNLGAKPATLAGLSGLGDLVLTCSSPQSRNFSYGMALGRGDSLDGLPLAEGVHTAATAAKLAGDSGIPAPIISAVVDVLEKRVTAREAVDQLLTRPLKREND